MNKHSKSVLLLAAALVIGLAPVVGAEEEEREIGKWYPTLETGLNLLQSSYSSNWQGGDKGSVVWSWLLNATLDKRFDEKLDWSNSLKLAFGQTHQQARDADGELVWQKPDKTTDLIDLESILRFTLGAYVDPYASFRLESQFQDATDPDGRELSLNPMKFSEAAGIARKFIDETDRSMLTRLGFSFRQSSRKSFTEPAPSDVTETESTNDGGIELVTDYKDQILDDRVAWTSRLSFYKPVFFSGKDEIEAVAADSLVALGLDADLVDYTTTMDIDWENIFTTQITKAIAVNFYLRWVYDKYDNTVMPLLNAAGDNLANASTVAAGVRKKGQFKQTMAIGVTYRFF